MSRDPRYDVLFEPLKIGPVTAKIGFYQVLHCTAMGWLRPHTFAAMRVVEAEGGWARSACARNGVAGEDRFVPPGGDGGPSLCRAQTGATDGGVGVGNPALRHRGDHRFLQRRPWSSQ